MQHFKLIGFYLLWTAIVAPLLADEIPQGVIPFPARPAPPSGLKRAPSSSATRRSSPCRATR